MRRVGQIGEDVLGPPGYLDAVHNRRHDASFVMISADHSIRERRYHLAVLDPDGGDVSTLRERLRR
jgi:hypothetical protein